LRNRTTHTHTHTHTASPLCLAFTPSVFNLCSLLFLRPISIFSFPPYPTLSPALSSPSLSLSLPISSSFPLSLSLPHPISPTLILPPSHHPLLSLTHLLSPLSLRFFKTIEHSTGPGSLKAVDAGAVDGEDPVNFLFTSPVPGLAPFSYTPVETRTTDVGPTDSEVRTAEMVPCRTSKLYAMLQATLPILSYLPLSRTIKHKKYTARYMYLRNTHHLPTP
jgi:hypothetical protein